MAKLQLPKLVMRVRFPLPAPKKKGAFRRLSFLGAGGGLRTRRKFVGVCTAVSLHKLHRNTIKSKLLLCKLLQFALKRELGVQIPVLRNLNSL